MPKIVDHEQRRDEIGAAAETVLVDEGWQGVTLRGIASRAGWSTSSVRHYFPNQHCLRRYVAHRTARLLREQVGARLQGPRQTTSVIERVASIVEELLPLDEQRRREYALWDALVAWERDQPADEHSAIWTDQRNLYRRCIAALTGSTQASNAVGPPELDERREAWASYLHALIDGLAAQMAQTPDRTPAEAARALLRSFLAEATHIHRPGP